MYCVKLTRVKKGRRYASVEIGAFNKKVDAEKAANFLLNTQKKHCTVDMCRKLVYLPKQKIKVYFSAGTRTTPYPTEDPAPWLYWLEQSLDKAYCKGNLD